MSKFTSADFESLSSSLDLPTHNLLIVADGAGNYVDTECGWYYAAHDRKTGIILENAGGATGGTNNYAELAPFCHALWAFHTTFTPPPAHQTKVVCVSDSEVTVKCGNRLYERRANASLWASIEWFENAGYKLTWRHVPRNSNPINTYADQRAKELRGFFRGSTKLPA